MLNRSENFIFCDQNLPVGSLIFKSGIQQEVQVTNKEKELTFVLVFAIQCQFKMRICMSDILCCLKLCINISLNLVKAPDLV